MFRSSSAQVRVLIVVKILHGRVKVRARTLLTLECTQHEQPTLVRGIQPFPSPNIHYDRASLTLLVYSAEEGEGELLSNVGAPSSPDDLTMLQEQSSHESVWPSSMSSNAQIAS